MPATDLRRRLEVMVSVNRRSNSDLYLNIVQMLGEEERMTFLDVLVDGEIVLEAMLVDREAEEIIYKGSHLARRFHNIASNIIERLPSLNYCILTMPNRKYLIMPINESKYLMLGLSSEVKAEDFIVQINKTFRGIEALNHQ